MRTRLLLGPVLVAVLVAILYADAKAGRTAPVLLALAVVLGARAAWELVELLRIRSFHPQAWLAIGCSLAVISSNWVERFLSPEADIHVRSVSALGPVALTFALSLLVLMTSEAMRYEEPGRSMESLGAELLTVGYVGVLISATAQLRWVAGSDAGYLALGSLIVATKAGDTGAYFLGKYLGRRKMHVKLSPGKTWMGARGALLGASVGSVLWFELAAPLFNPKWPRCPWHWSILFGLAIGAVGLIGDLCESLIKRDTGKKDSAVLVPEFGGLLDLLDSVIFAAPVAYLLWLILPLGP